MVYAVKVDGFDLVFTAGKLNCELAINFQFVLPNSRYLSTINQVFPKQHKSDISGICVQN